jgi:hypothetical protein
MGKLSPRLSVPGEIPQLSLVAQNFYDYIIHLWSETICPNSREGDRYSSFKNWYCIQFWK